MTYPPPYYTDDDPDFAHRIMTDYGFAVLVSDGLAATHLPLLFKDEGDQGALYGHIARANPMATTLDGGSALAIFSGPHDYVSATLYDRPDVSVPTWNYIAVQARGTLHTLPESETLSHLQEMAAQYEGPDGWSVSDAPDYVERLRRAIIPIRLQIESVQTFRKLSGNKPPAIRKRIIDAARARGEEAFAQEMERAS